jgi:hypothetical protein
VDELETWLAPLGLAQLAPTLPANDVDLAILPALSEADLEKLGLSLGHRRKIRKNGLGHVPGDLAAIDKVGSVWVYSHPDFLTSRPSRRGA